MQVLTLPRALPSSHEMARGRAGQWEHRTAPQVCGALRVRVPGPRSFRPLVHMWRRLTLEPNTTACQAFGKLERLLDRTGGSHTRHPSPGVPP